VFLMVTSGVETTSLLGAMHLKLRTLTHPPLDVRLSLQSSWVLFDSFNSNGLSLALWVGQNLTLNGLNGYIVQSAGRRQIFDHRISCPSSNVNKLTEVSFVCGQQTAVLQLTELSDCRVLVSVSLQHLCCTSATSSTLQVTEAAAAAAVVRWPGLKAAAGFYRVCWCSHRGDACTAPADFGIDVAPSKYSQRIFIAAPLASLVCQCGTILRTGSWM